MNKTDIFLTKDNVAYDSMWIAFARELEEENVRLHNQINNLWKPMKNKLAGDNERLRAALEQISTMAHCIALSGPATTPTLQDAWGKFIKIDVMARAALGKELPIGWTKEYIFGNGMDCDVYISPEGIAYTELPKP